MTCLLLRTRESDSHSRQSAKLFLQSSELGLPQPLTCRRVCPPSRFWGEGHTRWRERGWESPNSDDWRKSLRGREWESPYSDRRKSQALCLLCGPVRSFNKHWCYLLNHVIVVTGNQRGRWGPGSSETTPATTTFAPTFPQVHPASLYCQHTPDEPAAGPQNWLEPAAGSPGRR
jgi:hypothetical protein